MRLLTLSDVLAISGPERQRLREADEAIRDVVTLVDAQAAEDKLDVELISKAMIDLLLLAAARLALVSQPNSVALRAPRRLRRTRARSARLGDEPRGAAHRPRFSLTGEAERSAKILDRESRIRRYSATSAASTTRSCAFSRPP